MPATTNSQPDWQAEDFTGPSARLTRDEKNRYLSFVGAELCGYVQALLDMDMVPENHRESGRQIIAKFWSINDGAAQ